MLNVLKIAATPEVIRTERSLKRYSQTERLLNSFLFSNYPFPAFFMQQNYIFQIIY